MPQSANVTSVKWSPAIGVLAEIPKFLNRLIHCLWLIEELSETRGSHKDFLVLFEDWNYQNSFQFLIRKGWPFKKPWRKLTCSCIKNRRIAWDFVVAYPVDTSKCVNRLRDIFVPVMSKVKVASLTPLRDPLLFLKGQSNEIFRLQFFSLNGLYWFQ